jgi:PIN domain nuclease of toxin-antitoxin system
LRVLLDTNTFIWFLTGSPRLSAVAKGAIQDVSNDVLVSASTVWELALKANAGKLDAFSPIAAFYERGIAVLQAVELPIRADHALRAAELPLVHRDPFDRMLVAQAQAEGVPLLTNDPRIREYDVSVVW